MRSLFLPLHFLFLLSFGLTACSDSSTTQVKQPDAATADLIHVSCSGGSTLCGEECVILQRDPLHCGKCGNPCPAGQVCNNSECALTCSEGLLDCDGSCVDPLRDLQFCGATSDCQGSNAGQTCAAAQTCVAGNCSVACPSGQLSCDGSCVDPQVNPQHCGAAGDCSGEDAGQACAAGEVCSGGVCGLTCQKGMVKCDGKCIDPLTDLHFCGALGGCQNSQAGQTCVAGEVCSAGTCALSCQAGLVKCNGKCIAPLTDLSFCGALADCAASPGEICAAGEVCSGGQCNVSCQAGLVKCSGKCVESADQPRLLRRQRRLPR